MLISRQGCPNGQMIGVWMTGEEAFALEALVLAEVEKTRARMKAACLAGDEPEPIEVGQVWLSSLDGVTREVVYTWTGGQTPGLSIATVPFGGQGQPIHWSEEKFREHHKFVETKRALRRRMEARSDPS